MIIPCFRLCPGLGFNSVIPVLMRGCVTQIHSKLLGIVVPLPPGCRFQCMVTEPNGSRSGLTTGLRNGTEVGALIDLFTRTLYFVPIGFW